ncbi:hypothetical protein G7043_38690 [Lentzea sp. NEAU-D13]|uniref:Putative amidase domain-containing protein n=1 Tax=Lentzea alba TaxID=2714351 RepID=A0A7C9W7F5_9PSEU|nr:amidase domain-containing protein [Lentzea alba]NGY64859.1 hypothetical protein [Lentzea alba]
MSLLLAVASLVAVSVSGTAQAVPDNPSPEHLASLARDLLLVENAAVLADSDRARATAGIRPALTGAAVDKAAARLALSQDRAVARDAAGARVSTVTTEVKVESVEGGGTSRTAVLVERSGHPVDGARDGATTGTSRHRVSYQWLGGSWAISDIVALDAASEFSEGRMRAALAVPDDQRRAKIRERVSAVRDGIQANLPALKAADAAKMANKQVTTPDARQPGQGKQTPEPSGLGRPATRPFAGVATEQVGAQGGEGRPYNYQYMVDMAWYYAEDNDVPYVRDTNDCTTFISWVLWNGRYEERGSEALIDAVFNYDDYDVWYYRCNDCSPRKTYTWGGARNWSIYEYNYGGRVTFLQYLDDLLLSDVFQMDFNGYGDPPNIPDHTAMVTGRGSDGWPLLSYHTEDRRDKALWELIGSEDGPFWAART